MWGTDSSIKLLLLKKNFWILHLIQDQSLTLLSYLWREQWVFLNYDSHEILIIAERFAAVCGMGTQKSMTKSLQFFILPVYQVERSYHLWSIFVMIKSLISGPKFSIVPPTIAAKEAKDIWFTRSKKMVCGETRMKLVLNYKFVQVDGMQSPMGYLWLLSNGQR